ncbi:MAG TPA: hypothetical protein VIU11_09875 [Nakamurella sp.]
MSSIGSGAGEISRTRSRTPFTSTSSTGGATSTRSWMLLAKPFRVESGSEQVTGPILDADDQGSAARRIGEPRDFIGQMCRRGQVAGVPRQEYTTTAPPPGLFLAVHALTFRVIRQDPRTNLPQDLIHRSTEQRKMMMMMIHQASFRMKRGTSSQQARRPDLFNIRNPAIFNSCSPGPSSL